ncbi:hypothetical protein IIC65_05760 [Candidatus Sumerlaeota bacterium]|nr:hypothetical protein [Candidatus Sumerlaeota bacterium]
MGALSTAASDLTGLYSIFGDPPEDRPRARFVSADEVPEPLRALLAHDHHMTVTLERHYDARVNLIVIKSALDGQWYARKILLTESRRGRVIQFGIMRFNFQWCTGEVREKIIQGQTPLGRILAEHEVMRTISTHALMRIIPNQELRDCFALGRPQDPSDAEGEAVYGRLATIYCNEEPAVDLLEIPAPIDVDPAEPRS